MEEKVLYITDLDGTLMRGDLKISDFSIKTINGLVEKGMAFTYATGVIGSNEEDAVAVYLSKAEPGKL